MALTIYGVAASRAGRNLWALQELGVAYDRVLTDFKGDNKQSDFLAVNPNGRVPALKHDDLVLFESLAINLHLARTFGKGFLQPDTEADAALAVQWSFWAVTEVEKANLHAMFHAVGRPDFQDGTAGVEAQRLTIDPALKVLDQALDGRDFLVGDRFTIADLNVASVMLWAFMARMDLGSYPNMARWLSACIARDGRKAVGAMVKAEMAS
ncbi:MAG: glutathione S-transferase family protein [Alphaproteobacteria bacterium]|jgi:glutathione S-transferase